jgi:glutamine synthetase
LPASLKEALDEWETDPICVETLGKQLANKYVQAKLQEWNEYKPHQPTDKTEVTRWEQEKYLHN